MSYSVVYSSNTGNTKLLAETIKNTLPREELVYFGAPAPEALAADRIYVGFWTDGGACGGDVAEFLKAVGEKEVFLFGTAGFGGPGSREYYDGVLSNTQKHLSKSAKLAGAYMCQGKMPLTIRRAYEKMLSDPEKAGTARTKIENFDRASSHPDAEDLAALQAAVLAAAV